MTLSTQPIKGARDFYPEQMRVRNYIFSKWREVCERYGYEEYDAPLLEPTDLYLSKGNEEIIAEQTYTFTDRGNRSLTLRTEMTPTVSRMVAAKRQELPYPLRWYSIPQCWRYERMQRGRGREFYQLNVDMFGNPDFAADQELIEIADAIMKSFGAKPATYTIKLNSRKLMDYLLDELIGLNETQTQTMRRLIDGRAKVSTAEFTAKLDAILAPAQREAGKAAQLMAFLDAKTLDDIEPALKSQPSVDDLRQLLTNLSASGITNASFDPSLIRGFDYYTDIAFEVNDTNPENNRSMFGGGRYDGLVELFGAAPLSAVGFGMGDITLFNFLESNGLLPKFKPATELYVCGLGNEAQKVAGELREMGLNVAFDSTGRKLDKQIKTAEKLGIRYVLFVGDKEIADEQYALKDLVTGEQESRSLQRVVSTIKDFRKA
jgi:histidyl-tRNA synthetase